MTLISDEIKAFTDEQLAENLAECRASKAHRLQALAQRGMQISNETFMDMMLGMLISAVYPEDRQRDEFLFAFECNCHRVCDAAEEQLATLQLTQGVVEGMEAVRKSGLVVPGQ